MEIIFYENEKGLEPAKQFIESLSNKDKANEEIDLAIKHKEDYERRHPNEY